MVVVVVVVLMVGVMVVAVVLVVLVVMGVVIKASIQPHLGGPMEDGLLDPNRGGKCCLPLVSCVCPTVALKTLPSTTLSTLKSQSCEGAQSKAS